MGKVGSSTIREALHAHPGRHTIHSHWINPRSLDRPARIVDERRRRSNRYGDRDEIGRRIHRLIVEPRVPADIITLVRDPIARNVSSYFQHLDEIWGVKRAHQRITMPELLRGFLDVFEHDEPLNWFDDEIRDVFGIDVFDSPFPTDGWATVDHDPFRLLVMRADVEDDVKTSTLETFLDLRPLSLDARNVGEDKAYAEVYRAFRDQLRLPASHINRMLDSRYTRHFFDEKTIDRFHARWSGSSSATVTAAAGSSA